MKKIPLLCLVILFFAGSGFTQRVDRGKFVEYRNDFYDKIKKALDKDDAKATETDTIFMMDFAKMDLPSAVTDFRLQWHQPPVSQGRTGTCWSFATTSFFESEIKRLSGREMKLSEIYTVYWEYVEKARRYVQQRGESYFGEGSMANAVKRIWRKYGIVPADQYSGLKERQFYHDHKKMFSEMKGYLKSIKEMNLWNEDDVLANIKSILNHYLGEPPLKVIVDDRSFTPIEYLEEIVQLDLENYVSILSLKEKPYMKDVEYPVPDNWWKGREYFNVPLQMFIKIVKTASKMNHTVDLGGDVSEAGYDALREVAMVPTFDIPAKYINEDARQFRFSNKSTTDDHLIHIVGHTRMNKADWFIIKDSGSGARNGPNPGYRFYHEDYIKLKIMYIMVHKDVAAQFIEAFSPEPEEAEDEE